MRDMHILLQMNCRAFFKSPLVEYFTHSNSVLINIEHERLGLKTQVGILRWSSAERMWNSVHVER